jgi:mannose-6-phosphate isomerase-like protein (cupin superfamily)
MVLGYNPPVLGRGDTAMATEVKKVDKPWGYELIFAHTERYAGKILHVDAGQALSLQYHERKDETLYLLEGGYELTIEENGDLVQYQVSEGEAFHVPPGTRHRMVGGPEGCDILEVSTPELDDVVRLEDRYGRA